MTHPDDEAIEAFCEIMKAKMKRSRDKGRNGWEDPTDFTDTQLLTMFMGHMLKDNAGNFADLAILLMMMNHRQISEKTLAKRYYSLLTGN